MSTPSSSDDNITSSSNAIAFVPPNPHRQCFMDNSMGDFMNNLLMHRKPIDWSAIVLIGKSHHNLGHNALHLACTADDADIRAPSVHVVRNMLNVCGRQAVESVDKKDGRTLLHRAVVCVQEDLANYKLEDDDDEEEEDSESINGHDKDTSPEDDDDDDAAVTDESMPGSTPEAPSPSMTKSIPPILKSESLLVEIARLRQRYRKKWSSATTTHPSLYFCDIAAALLEYSDMNQSFTPELHQDDNGHTPLHVALKMCPTTPPPSPTSKSGKLPPLQFHSLERFHLFATLVSRCKTKGGLLLQDLKGHTPLHHCILDRLGGHIPSFSRSIPPMAMEIILTEACPEAISTPNDKGMTPLHLIAAKVPCRITINDESGGSSSAGSQREHIWNLFHHLVKLRPQALRMRDYDRGYTPLHYAVMNDAEGAIVEKILQAEKEGYQMMMSPEGEEDSHQSAAMVRDRSGFTALHLACFDRAENRVVKALLEHAPESALMMDDKGYTPLQKMWHSQVYWFCIIYEMLRRGRTSRLSVDFFARIVLFLKAMDPPPAGEGEAEWNVIHAAAKSNAPTPVLHIALHMEPNKAFEMNERGELPLHSACASPIVPFPTPLLPYNEEEDDDLVLPDVFRLTNIQTLLQVDPLAPMVPNSQRRFPLHLAILAGKPWSHGIRDVLTAAPHVLSTPDPVTGLFPFMMAATVGTTYDDARETATRVQDQLERKRQEAEEAEAKALAAEEESAKAWKNREKRVEVDRLVLERWRVAGEVFDEAEDLKRELKMKEATVELEVMWLNNTYKLLRALPALIEQAI